VTQDEQRAYNAAYYAKHREERLASFRAWKEANREAHRKGAADWQKNNPERSATIRNAYKKRHPEKVRAANKRTTVAARASHAARQSIRNRLLAVVDAGVLAVYAQAAGDALLPCHWCGCQTEKDGRQVDHRIPIAKGGEHTAGNLVIACTPCNLQKGALLPDEFRARRTK
jgi:5-methylcytosine-specific restriction endonuclease McrA